MARIAGHLSYHSPVLYVIHTNLRWYKVTIYGKLYTICFWNVGLCVECAAGVTQIQPNSIGIQRIYLKSKHIFSITEFWGNTAHSATNTLTMDYLVHWLGIDSTFLLNLEFKISFLINSLATSLDLWASLQYDWQLFMLVIWRLPNLWGKLQNVKQWAISFFPLNFKSWMTSSDEIKIQIPKKIESLKFQFIFFSFICVMNIQEN